MRFLSIITVNYEKAVALFVTKENFYSLYDSIVTYKTISVSKYFGTLCFASSLTISDGRLTSLMLQ